MKTAVYRRFNLSRNEIDQCSEEVFRYLTEHKVEKKEAIRIRFSLEEVLITWMEQLGVNAETIISCGRQFGRFSVRLQCRGAECNPFVHMYSENSEWVNHMRAQLEFLPVFKYANTYNFVVFTARAKTMSRLAVTVFAILMGILLGMTKAFLPEQITSAVCSNLFEPVYDAYLAAFSLCGIPLIFTSVLIGILSAGDITEVSNNGRKMLHRFFLYVFCAVLAAAAIALPFFKLNYVQDAGVFKFKDILDMILDWIPDGLFQPFINSNAMQLIILGAAFAVSIMLLNLTNSAFVRFVNELHNILQQIMKWIAYFIPLFVTVMIVNSIWASEWTVLLAAWKSFALTTGTEALVILALAAGVSVKFRIGILELLKKLSKLFLTALGTNSCTASIGDNYSCCENNLGIDPKVYTFGIPVGTTLFKPATAVRLVILCLFMAEAGKIPVSGSWFITLAIAAFVFSIAVPAIPGGVIMLCPLLFAQLNIPKSFVTQMLATDVFFDCFCTAFNQIAVPLTLVLHADSVGMLTDNIIKRPATYDNSKYEFAMEKKLRSENEEYHEIFTQNVKVCQKILSRYTSYFPTYTDHSALHSMQLLAFCNNMIGKNIEKLNCDEIFVILMAAYLHDAGMGISLEDYEEFSSKIPALSEYRKKHPDEDTANIIRKFHNELSGCYIEKYADRFRIPSKEHLQAIIQASRGHRKLDLADEDEFPETITLANGSMIRLPYIAALIRLSDELDVAADRNYGMDYDISVFTEKASVLAFRGHQAIRKMVVEEKQFTFYVDMDQDAELKQHIDETFEKLRETLNGCIHVVETRTNLEISQKFIVVKDADA